MAATYLGVTRINPGQARVQVVSVRKIEFGKQGDSLLEELPPSYSTVDAKYADELPPKAA